MPSLINRWATFSSGKHNRVGNHPTSLGQSVVRWIRVETGFSGLLADPTQLTALLLRDGCVPINRLKLHPLVRRLRPCRFVSRRYVRPAGAATPAVNDLKLPGHSESRNNIALVVSTLIPYITQVGREGIEMMKYFI